MNMLTQEELKPKLPLIKRSRHKYQAGYVVGLAGSTLMPGAAILSSTASLKAGAGIVRLFYPEGMKNQLVTSPYELICTPYDQNNVSQILIEMNRASAVFLGPGLGQTSEVKQLLMQILPNIQSPCVIDADALNILATEQFSIPKKAILTPHQGEMLRLLKINTKPKDTLQFLNLCLDFVKKHQITLVLKGAPTFILQDGYLPLVNPSGDPGMATAGSGDVLTGLIAGLLAQGTNLYDAASLGVYLHGISGEYAADELTSYCMSASDILYYFPEAFKFIADFTQNKE